MGACLNLGLRGCPCTQYVCLQLAVICYPVLVVSIVAVSGGIWPSPHCCHDANPHRYGDGRRRSNASLHTGTFFGESACICGYVQLSVMCAHAESICTNARGFVREVSLCTAFTVCPCALSQTVDEVAQLGVHVQNLTQEISKLTTQQQSANEQV